MIAAWKYAVLIIGIIAFQMALIAGAPGGHLTQGGAIIGALPIIYRVFAGVSIFVLTAMALGILSAAGQIGRSWSRWRGYLPLMLSVVSAIVNWATPLAAVEPITLVMLACAAWVMLWERNDV